MIIPKIIFRNWFHILKSHFSNSNRNLKRCTLSSVYQEKEPNTGRVLLIANDFHPHCHTKTIDFHLDARWTKLKCCCLLASNKETNQDKYVFWKCEIFAKAATSISVYCLQNTHNLKTGQTCITTKIAHQSFAIRNPLECESQIQKTKN